MRFLSSLWRWLRGKPAPQEVPPPPPPNERRAFLTRSPIPSDAHNYKGPSAESLLQASTLELIDTLPRLHTHIAGGTGMDSMDDEYIAAADLGAGLGNNDGAGTRALANSSAPNLSGAVVGFFLRQTFIGHQLSALLAQHWLIAKCCWTPAQDAIRKGFTVGTPNGDDDMNVEMIAALRAVDKRMHLADNLRNYIGFGKVFGIRVAIFVVESDDPEYYEFPFNQDAVKPGSYKGISLVDPYWCVPELDEEGTADPASMHFYEPTWWQINGKRYHRSHLCIYREGDVADILKPSYLYGGIPVPQRIVERVYAAERVANEGPELAMCKRLITLRTDLTEMLAGGPAALEKLEAWTNLMNNYGVKVIGESEEVNQYDTSLADFDALTWTEYQLVASGANMPATKLFGTSPKGFGASGDYEIEVYHEELETLQEKCTPLVERHHLLAMLSEVGPCMRRKYPNWVRPQLELTWNPLDTPTAKELTEMNEAKSRTALNLVNMGAIDGVDVRDQLIKDPLSGYTGIPGAYRPGEAPGPDEVPAPMPANMTAQPSLPDGF